jgi:hypothetical protein
VSELPRYILGVDPGKKTGVALLDLLAETCIGWELVDPEYGRKLEELIAQYRPAVVAENFIVNAATVKNTQAPWSLENIGIARFLADKYGCSFKKQAQSSAKRFATNERLQALGWYIPGKGHLADAQRQVLLFVTDHGWWHESLSAVDG